MGDGIEPGTGEWRHAQVDRGEGSIVHEDEVAPLGKAHGARLFSGGGLRNAEIRECWTAGFPGIKTIDVQKAWHHRS